jgi:hypothetical protein
MRADSSPKHSLAMKQFSIAFIWLALFGIAFSADAQSATPIVTPSAVSIAPTWLRGLVTYLDTPEGNHIFCYIITMFGTTAMYVFSLHKGFQGAMDFLKRCFPDHTPSFYARLDFFLVIVLGSIIGFILFSPATAIQSLCAGLGWVGAMNTVVSKPT